MNSQKTVLWIPWDQGVIEDHFLSHAYLFSHPGVILEVISGKDNDLKALDRFEEWPPIDAIALPQYLPLGTKFSKRMEDKGFIMKDSYHFGEVVAKLIRNTRTRNPFPTVSTNCPILLIWNDTNQWRWIDSVTLTHYFNSDFPDTVRTWVSSVLDWKGN